MGFLRGLLLVLFYLSVGIQCEGDKDEETLVVKTELGKVKGFVDYSLPNKVPFVSFRAIPYAQAPTGPLRFQPPVPLDHWPEGDELDGRKTPTRCVHLSRDPQVDGLDQVKGGEDCLMLNVFAPKSALEDRHPPLPVMVLFGESATAHRLMDSESVLLVTVHSRVGPLGWLSFENDRLQGNQGLMDQAVALAWIRKHVGNFGGDANRITAIGHSEGGVNVIYQMVSPLFQGLLDQAIVMSGPAVVSPMLHMSEGPAYYAYAFAEAVGCGDDTDDGLRMKCLQAIPVDKLALASSIFGPTYHPWHPVVDGEFLSPGVAAVVPTDPRIAILEGRFKQIPLVVGVVENEGATILTPYLSDPAKMKALSDDFDDAGSRLLLGVDEHAVSDQDVGIVNLIRLNYLREDNSSLSVTNALEISHMLTDFCYHYPTHLTVEMLAQKTEKPVYYYHFNYHRSNSNLANYNYDTSAASVAFGAVHGDDESLLFQGEEKEYSVEDLKMTKKLVSLWTSFASSSKPTDHWVPVSSDNVQYAVLDLDSLRMARAYDYGERMTFARSMLDLVDAYRHFDPGEHPALLQRMKEKEEEMGWTEHDEL